jgi:hypothetical protein
MRPDRSAHLHVVSGGKPAPRSRRPSPPSDAELSREPIEGIGSSPERSCGRDTAPAALGARECPLNGLAIVEATERADEVMTFIACHVAAQNLYGTARGLALAGEIARLGESLGEAAALAASGPVDEPEGRAMAGWLACAAADGLLAAADMCEQWIAEPRADLDRRLVDLGAWLVFARLLSARRTLRTQLTFVYREFGELCNSATWLSPTSRRSRTDRRPAPCSSRRCRTSSQHPSRSRRTRAATRSRPCCTGSSVRSSQRRGRRAASSRRHRQRRSVRAITFLLRVTLGAHSNPASR